MNNVNIIWIILMSISLIGICISYFLKSREVEYFKIIQETDANLLACYVVSIEALIKSIDNNEQVEETIKMAKEMDNLYKREMI